MNLLLPFPSSLVFWAGCHCMGHSDMLTWKSLFQQWAQPWLHTLSIPGLHFPVSTPQQLLHLHDTKSHFSATAMLPESDVEVDHTFTQSSWNYTFANMLPVQQLTNTPTTIKLLRLIDSKHINTFFSKLDDRGQINPYFHHTMSHKKMEWLIAVTETF